MVGVYCEILFGLFMILNTVVFVNIYFFAKCYIQMFHFLPYFSCVIIVCANFVCAFFECAILVRTCFGCVLHREITKNRPTRWGGLSIRRQYTIPETNLRFDGYVRQRTLKHATRVGIYLEKRALI